MKLLVFTDTHGMRPLMNNLAKQSQNCDFSICCGDYTFFSKNLTNLLKLLNKFKNLYLINGNHELNEEVIKLIQKHNLKNIHFIDSTYAFFKDILLIGFSAGIFSPRSYEYKKFLSTINIDAIISEYKKKHSLSYFKPKLKIFVSHGPPYGCRNDLLETGHVGNMYLSAFLKKNNFDYCFTGHLHENFNTIDQINKTVVINPGPKGLILNI